MIDWPWRRNSKTFSIPGDIRVYAIGDVHGRADLLKQLHARISADTASHGDHRRNLLIHLGDYVDRGENSAEVLEILSQRQVDGIDDVVCLKGNHEDLLQRFLNGDDVARAWTELGGNATLASYGINLTPDAPPDQRFEVLRQALIDAMPPSHTTLLSELALFHQVGDYLFVHAGIRPKRDLEQQRPQDLIWIRDLFLDSKADHGAMVVHGHHCTPEPDIRANRIGIDTGAYYSNRLTCLVLENDQRRFLYSSGKPGA